MKTPGGEPGSSLTLSIMLHGLLAGVIIAAWWWHRAPEPVGERLALTATVVAARTAPTLPPPDSAPPQPDPAPEPETPAPPDPEASRLQAEAEARAKAAEVAHVAEERRIAAERAEAEREVREKADKEKAEKEKVERERRARVEAEKARAAREAELNAQLAAEARLAAARASGQMAQYISQITAKIERAWIRPPGATSGLQCEVRVTQVPGGVVTGAQVGRCNGDDSIRQSIEAAVYRASPLPQPADPALFERNLVVTFRPEH